MPILYPPPNHGCLNASSFSSIQAAVTAAAGRTVCVDAGTYILTSAIAATTDLDLRLAEDAILDISGAASATTAITATGSIGSALALTANAVVGATSISMSAPNAATLATGDFIKVSSGAIYDPGRTDSPIGEIIEVASVSGTTVNLIAPLVGGDYNTADTAIAQKLTLIKASVTGGQIVGGGAGDLHKGIKFTYTTAPRVTGVRISGTEDVGIWLVDSLWGKVSGNHLSACGYASTGYGVNVSSCVQDTEVSGNTMTECRHAFTTSTASGIPGLPRRILVDSNRVFDTVSSGDALDTHTPTEDITFSNNIVYSAANAGINIECPSATVIGNTLISTANDSISLQNPTLHYTRYLVQGNTICKSADKGITYSSTDASGVGANIHSVDISGNTIIEPTGRAIYAVSTDSWRIHTTSIRNNNIRFPLNATAVINLSKADDCIVTGNLVTDVPSTAVVLRFDDVTRTLASGNNARGVSASTNRGFSGTSCSYMAVLDNMLTGFGTGISFDDASNNCSIRNNRTHGCTTLIAPGVGTNMEVVGTDTRYLGFIASDADLTLTAYVSQESQIHSGTLTADRTITLSTTNVWVGARFRITRTGSGAFNLSVGGLKNLVAGTWCDVVYNGSVWALVAYGAL